MADIQNLDRKAVKPLTLLNKTNEVIDAINEELNTSYTEQNPLLTSIDGVCTWTVTHNLGTTEISCTVYEGDNEVFAKVETTSENVVTITINSSSNIIKDTYSVLVLAKGGLGGSSSIAVDSEFSSTSINPVQNRTLYPSLSKFIPKDTVITVKTDGTGDFTTLSDAINYLNGKWSNGSVTIKLGVGNFVENQSIALNAANYSIPCLNIFGNSSTNTIIDFSNAVTDGIQVWNGQYVNLRKIQIKGSGITNEKAGINLGNPNTSCQLEDTIITDFSNCIYADNFSKVLISNGTFSFKNCKNAFYATRAEIRTFYGSIITFENISEYACRCENSGIINCFATNSTYINVVNKANKSTDIYGYKGQITGADVRSISDTMADNFLPRNTSIYVKTDSTGDFTTLSAALAYLENKWSNGTVWIYLDNGIFNETGTINIGSNFHAHNNIPIINIAGSGVDNTFVQWSFTTNGSTIMNINDVHRIKFSGITFKNATYETDKNIWGMNIWSNSLVEIVDCNFENLSNAIACNVGSHAHLSGTINITKSPSGSGIVAQQTGRITSNNNITLNFDTCNRALGVYNGSILQLSNPTLTFKSVTTKCNITPNTVTSNGIALGFTV